MMIFSIVALYEQVSDYSAQLYLRCRSEEFTEFQERGQHIDITVLHDVAGFAPRSYDLDLTNKEPLSLFVTDREALVLLLRIDSEIAALAVLEVESALIPDGALLIQRTVMNLLIDQCELSVLTEPLRLPHALSLPQKAVPMRERDLLAQQVTAILSHIDSPEVSHE
jgi:hypothetical protein